MTNTIKKTGFSLGLALGIVLILLSAYIFFFDLKLYTNVLMGILTILVTLAFGIASILVSKKKLGGFITFKESFSSYFFTILTGKFLVLIFVVLMSTLILSPETKLILKNQIAEFTFTLMKRNSLSAAEIAKAFAASKSYDPFSLLELISPAVKYLLRDCIIGFLAALVIRNKREELST